MKKFLLIFVVLNILLLNISFGYEYFEVISGYKGKVLKVTKDGDYKIVVSTSETGDNLETLVKNKGGVAGINGAYFCPKDYSQCGGKNSIHGDRISDGKISSKWKNTGVRYIFGFTKDNENLIHKSPDDQVDNFDGIYNGISNFPLILKNGKSSLLEYTKEIDEKMKLRGPKNFICSAKNGDIYMGYINNQTIYTMVDVLKEIGCDNALNLDSGGSLAVYDKGYKKTGGREVMDAFIIVPKDGIIKKDKFNKDFHINQKIKSKLYLERKVKTKKYIKIIDRFVLKVENKKLEKILKRIDKIKLKPIKNILLKNVIFYLESAIILKISQS